MFENISKRIYMYFSEG